MEDVEVQMAIALGTVEKLLQAMRDTPHYDKRAAAVAKTHFETAFLWVANGTGEALFDG